MKDTDWGMEVIQSPYSHNIHIGIGPHLNLCQNERPVRVTTTFSSGSTQGTQ